MSLVTLAEMKTYLGISATTYDTFLTTEIDIISTAINNYCGRDFELKNYTQTIYADNFESAFDTKDIYLYHFPVTTIDSAKIIETDADGNDSELAITYYRLQKSLGLINRTYPGGAKIPWMCSEGQRAEFTYSAGYATIPSDIKSVVYSLVSERYNKKVSNIPLDFGSNVQRISVPGVIGVDYDYSLNSNERKSAFGMILGNYANVLDYHRSERALTGEIHLNYIEEN